MVWEVAALAAAAAVSGVVVREAVGLAAKATGHSKRGAEEAVGSVGLSLVAHPLEPEPPADENQPKAQDGDPVAAR